MSVTSVHVHDCPFRGSSESRWAVLGQGTHTLWWSRTRQPLLSGHAWCLLEGGGITQVRVLTLDTLSVVPCISLLGHENPERSLFGHSSPSRGMILFRVYSVCISWSTSCVLGTGMP